MSIQNKMEFYCIYFFSYVFPHILCFSYPKSQKKKILLTDMEIQVISPIPKLNHIDIKKKIMLPQSTKQGVIPVL